MISIQVESDLLNQPDTFHIKNLQDNYFHLPPNKNHSKRINDLSWVGINEINLKLMKEHLNTLTQKTNRKLKSPNSTEFLTGLMNVMLKLMPLILL